MKGDNILGIHHSSKTSGTNPVLKDINFSVSSRNVICIIGVPGSRRFMLLCCLNPLEIPTIEEIVYHGTNIIDKKISIPQYCSRVRIVFQSLNLPNSMTVFDNCIISQTKILRKSRAEAQKNAMYYLGKVGMAPYINAEPRRLSGGQKQEVAIVRAFAMEPEVLLLDKPASALGPQMVGEVLEATHELTGEGLAIIVVTHEIAFARDVSSHAVFMTDDVIVEEGAPEQVFGTLKDRQTQEFLSRFMHG